MCTELYKCSQFDFVFLPHDSVSIWDCIALLVKYLMKDALAGVRKEAVVTTSRYCPGIFSGLRKTMRTRVRIGYTSECTPPKYKFGVITLHQSAGFEFCCTDTALCVDCCPES